MPYIKVTWTKGRSDDQRQAVAEGIARALQEGADIPPDHVWISFDDVDEDAFYVGADSIGERRRRRAKA